MSDQIFVSKGKSAIVPNSYIENLPSILDSMRGCEFSVYIAEPCKDPVIGHLRGEHPATLGYRGHDPILSVQGILPDEITESDIIALDTMYGRYLAEQNEKWNIEA